MGRRKEKRGQEKPGWGGLCGYISINHHQKPHGCLAGVGWPFSLYSLSFLKRREKEAYRTPPLPGSQTLSGAGFSFFYNLTTPARHLLLLNGRVAG